MIRTASFPLVLLAVFSVILPDLLIADRHLGFDLPLDKPHPHYLIKHPLLIGLHRGSSCSSAFRKSSCEMFLLSAGLDRTIHLFIADDDLGLPCLLLHEQIVDHPIQQDHSVFGRCLFPRHTRIGRRNFRLIGFKGGV